MESEQTRRDRILRLLGRNGYETIESLARAARVSGMTIRRDLTRLESDGLVRRTHGGVVSNQLGRVDLHYQTRATRLSREKRRIGQAAARLVRDGEVIFIDAGTTALAVAEFLSERRGLVVVTPSLPVAERLSAMGDAIDVHLLGGQMNHVFMATVGPRAEEHLATFHIDRAFLGAGGFDCARGLTRATSAEISLKKLASKLAKQTIVLADRTKFEIAGPMYFLPASQIDVLVTDANVDASNRAALKRNGVKLIRSQG